LTITVDGKAPSLSIVVTQENVAENNLVGDNYQSGNATITITADEPLSAIGDVYIIDNTTGENLTPAISLDNTGNTVFIGEFTVGEWDDNDTVVYVAGPCATDLHDIVNIDNATENIVVDTRAPILLKDGLADLLGDMVGQKTPAGTTYLYYVDNENAQTISGNVEDNWASGTRLDNTYDNVETILNVTVEWDSSSESWVPTPTPTPDNSFSIDITMSDGLTSKLKVIATDWTGNTTENYVDNIFIDTRQPTIVFNTIDGVAWDENDELINNNKPEIKVTITDLGLGVAYENLNVYLDNDDNINNGTPGAPYGELDNKSLWVVSTGVFENLIDNAGEGLVDGTYWIIVKANDNLRHTAAENENWAIAKQSFTIDATAPDWTGTVGHTVTTAIKFYWEETMNIVPTTTKITTWYIVGGAQESGSTIKVYAPDNTTLVDNTTASTTKNAITGLYDFTLSPTLSEGINKVYVEEIDKAGNSSGRVLYGTYTVDKTPPVVTLTGPADATTTDAAQITVSGTVVDALTSYDQISVRIDATGAYVGKTVYLNPDGSFNATVPLVEGTNVINVYAADAGITALAGNQTVTTRTVTRTVTPLTTYAIIIVVVALILAAIAIFRKW